MLKKKSQGGMNAAILVAIIAGLIILYIIFLPASERQKIVTNDKQPSLGDASNLLLDVSPGMLSTSQGMEAEKTIPNIFLVETTNAKELDSINSFIIRNGWFDKQEKLYDFEITDPDNTDNVVLSFTSKKRNGILTIKLNNNVIFESEVASDVMEPIKLRKGLLAKTNTLAFSTSSVGMKFWTTNEYSIDNAKIIGDITDTSRQQSTNIFTISQSEFSSMDKATLKFIPYCGSVNSLGNLDIIINNKKLISSIPTCDDQYLQSIPKSALSEGENNIVFKTNKGSYSVEQIKISLDFRQPQIKTYNFELSSRAFESIRNGEKNAILTISFAGSKNAKRANLDINGHIETIDTSSTTYSKNINGRISEGNNFIRLEPQEDLEIPQLKVELS